MHPRKSIEITPSKVRSAVTNGTCILHDVDGRSAWMRRLRDLISLHISDLGGEDNISHSERALINRASMLILQVEMQEQAFAANDGVASKDQLEVYQRVVNTLRRTLELLGLQRRQRDITPTLDDIADEIERENAAATQGDAA